MCKEKGLIKKYNLSRTDGTPIDPDSEYFVLKLTGDGDPEHLKASRKAIQVYAEQIKEQLPSLASDLVRRYGSTTVIDHKEKITVWAHRYDTDTECELTFEYSENVIECYWEPSFDGEPLEDRTVFALDYDGNFKQVIERILQIWN